MPLCGALACAAPRWDAEAWARGRPELAGRSVGRLGDATPYLLPADDTLHLFLCRWSLGAPLRTSLPPDASAAERRLLERVLEAWERALPGLRFAVEPGAAPLRIRFADGDGEAAHASARCRVTPPFAGGGEALSAALVDAEVSLRRVEGDAWGRPRPLSPAELAGAAAHEIGHALGLQAHASKGRSALRREAAAVRRLGERLLRGEPLDEPAAAALYALPSGVRVAARALPPGSTGAADAIARRARARGVAAVELQLGDTALRVAWGSDPDLIYYLRDPAKLLADARDLAGALAIPPR